MRAEKEVSDAVKPGNRPAPLKPEGDWSHAFSYHPMDVEVQKAEGIHYYDVEGNQYIDASGGKPQSGLEGASWGAAVVKQFGDEEILCGFVEA